VANGIMDQLASKKQVVLIKLSMGTKKKTGACNQLPVCFESPGQAFINTI
jgi:hypothetical protein